MLGVRTGAPACKAKGGPVGVASGVSEVGSGVGVGVEVGSGVSVGVEVRVGVGVHVEGRKISGVGVAVGGPSVGGKVGGG